MEPTSPLSSAPSGRQCPNCGTVIRWAGNANRPFCSLSCRLIDLGAWLDERYRVAGRCLPAAAPSDDRVPDEDE